MLLFKLLKVKLCKYHMSESADIAFNVIQPLRSHRSFEPFIIASFSVPAPVVYNPLWCRLVQSLLLTEDVPRCNLDSLTV